MKKTIFPVLFVVMFVVFVVIMLTLLNAETAPKRPVDTRIAAIVYGGGSSDRWKAVELGVRQAFRELDMETPVLYVATDAQAELGMIEREVSDGAAGLLLAPADSEAMSTVLEPLTFSIRTAFILNTIDGFSYIAADDAGMGALLARELAQRTDAVALLPEPVMRESVRRRREAFLEEMERAGVSVRTLENITPEEPQAAALKFRADEVLVALETETLEQWIDALADITEAPPLSGIGSSDKIVSAMTQGIVDCLVFQNEYAVGYIAAMQLARQLGLSATAPDTAVQYLFVDAQTMYDTDVARILFNVIQ